RPQPRCGAPGHQAREHPALRRGGGRRGFRHCARDRGGRHGEAEGHRTRRGHARLYEPGAGDGRSAHRRAGGYLRPGLCAVRDAGGASSVSGHDGPGSTCPTHARSGAAAAHDPPRGAPGRGACRVQGAGEVAGGPVSQRGGLQRGADANRRSTVLDEAGRTSGFSFKGKEVDVREIGNKLNVGYVLEGSVRRAGPRLRVSAQLINATTGYHLWSDEYDRDAGDVFAVQDEITRAIVGALRLKLSGAANAALVKPATGNAEAHDLYLQGRYFFAKRDSTSLRKAQDYFER